MSLPIAKHELARYFGTGKLSGALTRLGIQLPRVDEQQAARIVPSGALDRKPLTKEKSA